MDEDGLRRRRDRALKALVVGMVLLLLFGIGFASSAWLSTGGGAGILAAFVSPIVAIWLFVAIMVFCAGSIVTWMWAGWRLHRKHDAWAYDPAVDGPDPRVRRGLEDAEASVRAADAPRPPPR